MSQPIQEKFGYVKRELRLKVFKLNLEVEQLKNKVAEANTERDSALDEAVVAWGELDSLQARVAQLVTALQDAVNIIQSDANTEENYGSLCRMGSVLAKKL
jgi:SMC interacting uncharacterized protein involved in chromosome segregation